MRGGASGLEIASSNDRGLSPQVGFVLLVGMVFIGAALVGISGWMLLDSLEGEAEAEVTYSAIETTDHGITTAARTGQTQSVSMEDGTYRDGGNVSIAWYAESMDAGNESIENQTLGAIEYETPDGTIAHQGGGIWEESGGQFRAYSEPPIGYDGDVLEVKLVTLNASDVGGSDETVRPNPDSDLPDRMQNITENATNRGYNNLTLTIESEYHDGWAEYFDSEFGHYSNVTVNEAESDPKIGNGGDNTVELVIENATETYSAFWVREDYGLDNSSENVYIDAVESNPPRLEAEIENRGDEYDEQDVAVVVEDDTGSVVFQDARLVTLDGKDSTTVGFSIAESALTYGEEYTYNFETEDGNSLDNPGSFYYAKQEDPYLDITNPRVNGSDASDSNDPVVASGENVTISVDIQNIGATDLSEKPDYGELELQLDTDAHPDDDPYDLAQEENPYVEYRNASETETATWEINRSKLLQSDHEFTINATKGGQATGYFTVEQGVNVEDTEIILDPGTEVNISVIGTELSRYDPYNNRNYWLPIYLNVFTQPVDEYGNAAGDRERHTGSDGLEWADSNLNQHDKRLHVYEYNFTTTERVSLMLQGRSYTNCYEWQYEEYEDEWSYYDCPTEWEYNERVNLTAETDTEESNVRVLNESRNELPELEPGIEVQKSVDELLERDEVDIDVTEGEDGTGYLDLAENETIFLFELTHHPEQHNEGPELDEDTEWTNERYWQEAFERDNDPNFNDAIAHVEFDQQVPEHYEADGNFSPGIGDPVDVGSRGDSSDDEGYGMGDPDVDVGSDEIIIG